MTDNIVTYHWCKKCGEMRPVKSTREVTESVLKVRLSCSVCDKLLCRSRFLLSNSNPVPQEIEPLRNVEETKEKGEES